MKDFNNTVKAVIFGHAVADALGVPVEFCDRDELDKNPVTDMTGFGTYPYPEGCWSDDTSMSLGTLESLTLGMVNYDDIMINFGKWYYKDEFTPTGEMFDVGNTCSYAIDNYFVNKKPVNLCGLDNEQSNGNGSLMRIHPVALYLYTRKNLSTEEKIEIIHSVSALTHAHERSKIACGIYAFVLWELMDNPVRESILNGLNKAKEYYKSYPESDKYSKLFNKTFILTKRSDISSSGYVVATLEAAVYCLLHSKSYEECVLSAVNLGDDTDTVGAIAGGLAGALYGLDSIPEKWLKALKKKEYIDDMCERAVKAW